MKSADAIIVALLVLCGSGIAATYGGAARRSHALPEEPGFNQRVFGAALMGVCGRPGVTPVVPMSPEPHTPVAHRPLIDFLARRQETLTCGQIPADVPHDGLDALQRASRYLILLATTTWRVSGPTWVGIDRLLGLMFGLSVGLAYLTCRVKMPSSVSLAIALLFMLSPLQLANAGDLRDYAKAPFFLASLLIVALLVSRRRAPAIVLALAAAAGAVLGFGFGVRTDIALNLIVVIGAIVGFLADPMRESWKLRIGAAALCVAMFVAMSFPVVRSGESVSNMWHVSVLGYAHEWDSALGIAPGPYEPSYFYNDSYVASAIDAYWGRVSHAPVQMSVGLPQYPEASRAYYALIVSTFPSDALLRAWASTIKVLELPFSGLQSMPRGLLPDILWRIILMTQRLLSYGESYALLLVGIAILGVSGRSVRLAILMFALVLFLGAYPAIQFQRRHIFHLEFLSLWFLGFAVSMVWAAMSGAGRNAEPVWRIRRPAAFAATVAILVLVPLAALRAHQQRSASALFATYSEARLQQIDARPEAVGNGLVRVAIRDESLFSPPEKRSMFSDMLVGELSADRCAVDRSALTFRYRAKDPSVDFTRTYDVDVPPAGAPTRVYFPVFRTGPASPDPDLLTFAGLEVAESELSCLTRVARFAEPDRFSLLLPAQLPAGWRELPLHQTLRGWERDRLRDGAKPFSYWAPMSLRNRGAALIARSVNASPGIAAAVDYRARIASVDASSGVSVNGVADATGTNLVAWKEQALEASSVIVAEGVLEQGGVTIGLVDPKGWSMRVDIDTPGAFRAFVQPPNAGAYQLVVANHLSDASLRNRFRISRLVVMNGEHE